MHLVDEQDGVAARALQRRLGGLHRLADVLHAREHRRQGDELGVEGLRHEPGEGDLARARRTPQDHRVRIARLEGHAQRLAGPEQMALADDLVDALRAQRLRERRRRLRPPEQIAQGSPSTSAPGGGLKRNSPGSTFGLRTMPEKRSTVVWPKWSESSIACTPSAPKPMRTRSKPASRSRGFASSHSRPSRLPPSESSNAFSMSALPASSA